MTGEVLKGSYKNNRVTLTNDGKYISKTISTLIAHLFPEDPDEIWKDILEYENYEVSNNGNVRNKTTRKILP